MDASTQNVIKMLRRAADATARLVFVSNGLKRGSERKASEEEDKAYTAVFLAITGRKPTQDELKEILGGF